MNRTFDKNKPLLVRTSPTTTPYHAKDAVPDRKARILCEDFKSVTRDLNGSLVEKKVMLVAIENHSYGSNIITENTIPFELNGISENGTYRLINAPVKKTAWINLYSDWTTSCMYSSEGWAKSSVSNSKHYLTTVKVEWEE